MSPTFPEARAAKNERLRREQRYYTPDKRGPRCWACKGWTDPVVSASTGEALHPTCATPELMGPRQARQVAPRREDPPAFDENGKRLKHQPLRELVDEFSAMRDPTTPREAAPQESTT